MRNRLLWKLLGVNVLVIGVVILVVWLAIDYLAADYFMVLMKKYHIAPIEMHHMFLEAVHRYLLWASIVALGLAFISGLILTRRVLAPLSQMTDVSQKIASGDYTARIHISSGDEVGQLATAFNRMADSLERMEQLRKSMVIDIAHEIRTPLTNMRGYLEGLRDGVVAPSKNNFKSLHEETLRLANLVEDLLELARADASKGTLHRKGLNLRELALRVVEVFQRQLAAKGITAHVDLSDVSDQIYADPEKLLQIFRNLFQNAWQYTPSGGNVRVFGERTAGRIKVIFANTGEGISEKDLPFIFERFYRGEKSRSREHGGAGIGLAIVKELVEAHGGDVGAESTPSETRVWFTLPV